MLEKILVIAAFFTFSAPAVFACKCGGNEPSADIAYQKSGQVMLLRIVSFDNTGQGSENPFLNRRVQFAVEKVYKGTAKTGDKLWFSSGPASMCIMNFVDGNIGKRLLYYGTKPNAGASGTWSADRCGRTAYADSAAEDIAYLDKMNSDCTAAPPSVLDSADAAKNIFTARVDDRKYTIERGGIVTPGRSKLTVRRVFKGNLKPGDTVYLTGGDGECSMPFSAATELLLYLGDIARGGAAPAPLISDRSGPLDEREGDIRYLKNLGKVNGPAYLFGVIDFGALSRDAVYSFTAHSGKKNYLAPLVNGRFEFYELPPGEYTLEFAVSSGTLAKLFREENGKFVLAASKIADKGIPPVKQGDGYTASRLPGVRFQIRLASGAAKFKLVLSKPSKAK